MKVPSWFFFAANEMIPEASDLLLSEFRRNSRKNTTVTRSRQKIGRSSPDVYLSVSTDCELLQDFGFFRLDVSSSVVSPGSVMYITSSILGYKSVRLERTGEVAHAAAGRSRSGKSSRSLT